MVYTAGDQTHPLTDQHAHAPTYCITVELDIGLPQPAKSIQKSRVRHQQVFTPWSSCRWKDPL